MCPSCICKPLQSVYRVARRAPLTWALLALGSLVPALGFATPSINSPAVAPASIPLNTATQVTFTASITDPTVIASSVNLQQLGVNGNTYSNVGTLYDDGTHGDAVAGDGIFTLQTTLTETSPFPITFRVSAAVRGSLTRSFSNLFTLNVAGASPAVITFTSPSNLAFLNSSPVTVAGTVSDPSAKLTINGLPAPGSGSFSISVPIQEGNNTITAVATNTQGTMSTASLQVTLDTVPPRITIDSPYDGFDTTDASITVTGKANDTVVGTVNSQQTTVTVNGVVAQVANRGFQAVNVPLSLGNNIIIATGKDRAGNGGTAQITVRRDQPTQSMVKIVSGNNQTGTVGAPLSSPIVAGLFDGSGTPVSGQPVVFTVTQNNGTLDSGKLIESVTTDANGQAAAHWTLGGRSGAGNNIVEATAVGFAGSAVFSASGQSGTAAQINVDSGSNQIGAAGQPLPYPFVVALTDTSHNRLANVSVTFQVKKGGGNFAGQSNVTTATDSDGRALAILTLGPQDGIENNVVEATFPGNTGFPAAFFASGHVPGNPAATTITGVVLDNTNNPVPGATIRVYLQNVPAQQSVGLPPNVTAVSDLQGQFTVQPAPVGFVKIIADGSTVQRPGKWPNLEYDLVTVSGQTNTIGLPIYLVPLDTTPADQLCVSATKGGTLTLPVLPGFSLSVLPGAATFPGGSTSGCISVTAVHPDKIPMVPGFGQQPRFIVTIQPAGTLFSPPAAIVIPNADGLPPREVTEMYSFDHDLATFVSIGTGTVSDDGTVIRSDPGVGVLKAGWFCGGPPTPAGSVGVCGDCLTCNGSSCVADPSQNGDPISNNQCEVCQDGAPSQIPINPTQVQNQYMFGLPTPTLNAVTDDLNKFVLGPLGLDLSTNLLQIQGVTTTQQCCNPQTGLGNNTDGNVTGNFGGFTLQGKIWPPGPIPQINESTTFLGITLGFKAKFLGGLFVSLGVSVTGQVGYRKSDCDGVAADQPGCPYASLNTTFTPGFNPQLTGSAELDVGNAAFTGSIGLSLGNFSWPINLSSISYNVPDCSSNLTGGLLTAPSGTVSVSGSFSIGFVYNGNSFTFQKTWTVLSCNVFATSLPSCTVNPF